MEYERRLTVARSPAELFAFLCDDSRLVSWRDGLREVRRLDDGANDRQRRYAETIETPLGPKTVTVASNVDPAERMLRFAVLDGPVRPHGTIALAALGTGTELTYRIAYATRLPLKTPIDTLVFKALVSNVDRTLANISRLVEASSPPPR